MNKYELFDNIQKYKNKQKEKESELMHYGTLGQKWGVRKWQNPDGTFNEAGKERYFGTGKKKSKSLTDEEREENETKMYKELAKVHANPDGTPNLKAIEKVLKKHGDKLPNPTPEYITKAEIDEMKKRNNEQKNNNRLTNEEIFKKAFGKDAQFTDDETKELFDMEVNDIREAYRNGSNIDKLSKDFQYDKNIIEDIINSEDQKIGSTNNKTNKLLNSEKYKDLARNVGVDFLDPNDLASDNIKKDYKAVKNNINPFIVAMDDFAHGHDESAINYLNRFVKNKKEREILTKLCKKYGEKEKIVIEENNKKTEELINNIKTNKNLKGNNISNEEYEKILNDTKSNNDLKKENARNVADIGLYKLNQMGNGGGDPGDDGSRTWFIYEDQTIGLPELTSLYYQGYSKNYIKQYVKNVSDKLNNMSYDEQDEYYENHPGVWAISYANIYEYADDWIDTLFKKSK